MAHDGTRLSTRLHAAIKVNLRRLSEAAEP